MCEEQYTQLTIKHTADIAALWESSKSAHKRIDQTDRITEGIHKIAANVEGLALQQSSLSDKLDAHVIKDEAGQKSHGERIGALETEPGNRWKDVTKQILGLIVAAVFGIILAKLT